MPSYNAIDQAIQIAKKGYTLWVSTSFMERVALLTRYAQLLHRDKNALALLISQEVGKPLWESYAEVAAMEQKIPLVIEAYQKRCAPTLVEKPHQTLSSLFRPHGVLAILGPFNLPGHLPNGQIVPALLAGNAVVFKPSEWTPKVGVKIVSLLHEAGVPKETLQILLGGPEEGKLLAENHAVDGLLFTGSLRTGLQINQLFAATPGRLLALEMGGNNPLIVDTVSSLPAALYTILLSAFITSGQRCSCARRLIITPNAPTNLLEKLVETTKRLRVGTYQETPEPFMGPLIHKEAADKVVEVYHQLLDQGAFSLLEGRRLSPTLLSPSIVDISGCKEVADHELFGPLLHVQQAQDLDEAFALANATKYGLTAGLLSESQETWQRFTYAVKAGVYTYNSPTTGASGVLPFGGAKNSGNLRPGGYLMVDACSYPIALVESEQLHIPEPLLPGVVL